MHPSTLRHLAAEHRSLHTSPLPPNFLFVPSSSTSGVSSSSSSSSISTDLTQLDILLCGPDGTAYAKGLWRLHLKFPDDYPASPPKASFRTKIWHPNIDDATGSVCVDTLKRDWSSPNPASSSYTANESSSTSAAPTKGVKARQIKGPDLRLREVLVTISCLLIHPNPDSALNATAAKLFQEDYEAFRKQVELMTSIHASVPPGLKEAVLEAKRRGDEVDGPDKKRHVDARDDGEVPRPNGDEDLEWGIEEPTMTTKKRRRVASTQDVTRPGPEMTLPQRSFGPFTSGRSVVSTVFEDVRVQDEHVSGPGIDDEENEQENEEEASKENDPSLSPTPVKSPAPPPPSLSLSTDAHQHNKRKRALATIPLPLPVPVSLPPPPPSPQAAPAAPRTVSVSALRAGAGSGREGASAETTPIFLDRAATHTALDDDDDHDDEGEDQVHSSPRKVHASKHRLRETGTTVIPSKGAEVAGRNGLAIRGVHVSSSAGWMALVPKHVAVDDDALMSGGGGGGGGAHQDDVEAQAMWARHHQEAEEEQLDGDDEMMTTGEEGLGDDVVGGGGGGGGGGGEMDHVGARPGLRADIGGDGGVGAGPKSTTFAMTASANNNSSSSTTTTTTTFHPRPRPAAAAAAPTKRKAPAAAAAKARMGLRRL